MPPTARTARRRSCLDRQRRQPCRAPGELDAVRRAPQPGVRYSFRELLRGLSIRYRIDGVISTARVLSDADMAEQVISRLKVMAELDIGEQRIPQDGRFSVSIHSREVDFRVSIMPACSAKTRSCAFSTANR